MMPAVRDTTSTPSSGVALAPALATSRLWTRVVLGGIVAVHACAQLGLSPLWAADLCVVPDELASGATVRWLTLLTAPFGHASWLHVLFNALAWVQLGETLEVSVGTAQFVHLFWVTVVLSGVLLVVLSQLMRLLLPFLYTPACHLGLSGVLFCLLVLDTHATPTPQRSLLGVFQVPAARYPLLLLVAVQLLVPNASFLGHLSGLLVGYALLTVYDHVGLPSAAVHWLDKRLQPALGRFRYLTAPAFSTLPLAMPGSTAPAPSEFARWAQMTSGLVRSAVGSSSSSSSSSSSATAGDKPAAFPGQGQVLGSGTNASAAAPGVV